MPRFTLFPLAACVILVTTTYTLPVAAGTPDVFASADVDRDDFITRAEFGLWRLGAFNQTDANNDRILTRAEIGPTRRQRPGSPSWTSFDANHDGLITRAEVLAAPTPMFERLDRNRDGRLSREEAAAVLPFLARHLR
jgi:EF hand